MPCLVDVVSVHSHAALARRLYTFVFGNNRIQCIFHFSIHSSFLFFSFHFFVFFFIFMKTMNEYVIPFFTLLTVIQWHGAVKLRLFL